MRTTMIRAYAHICFLFCWNGTTTITRKIFFHTYTKVIILTRPLYSCTFVVRVKYIYIYPLSSINCAQRTCIYRQQKKSSQSCWLDGSFHISIADLPSIRLMSSSSSSSSTLYDDLKFDAITDMLERIALLATP